MSDSTRTVVITGAARGIGAGIAQRFVEDGWHVVLADVSADVVETAKRLRSATAVIADVTTTAGTEAVAAAVPDGVHALVNNAGITRDAMLHKMTEDEFKAVVRVNLGGPLRLIDALLPRLVDGAAIVNMSSKNASGQVGQFNYAVSKAGLVGATRSLALSLAPRVRVNAIAPAFIATEMTDAIPDPVREKILTSIPFGRAGQPSEIADVALWLSSEQSSYVTGQVLAVCGGRSLAF